MDELITLILYAIYIAIAYGLIGFVGGWLKSGEAFDFRRLASTIIYSIFVGFMGVYTGILNFENINFLSFDQLFASYVTILLVINKVIDGVWAWYKQMHASKKAGFVPVDFSIIPTTVKVGEPVTFTDVTVDKTIYLWDFGDGALSNDKLTTTHTYKKAGTFKVGAIANFNGAPGALYKEIVITGETPPPTPTPVKGYWEQLWKAIVDIINAFFGK